MEDKIKFLTNAHTKIAEKMAFKEDLRKDKEKMIIALAQDTKNSKDLAELSQAMSDYTDWCEKEISPHKALYDDLEVIFQNINSLYKKASLYSEQNPDLKIKKDKIVYHLYSDEDNFCGLFNNLKDLELHVKNIGGDAYINHSTMTTRASGYEYAVSLKTKRYQRIYYVKTVEVE